MRARAEHSMTLENMGGRARDLGILGAEGERDPEIPACGSGPGGVRVTLSWSRRPSAACSRRRTSCRSCVRPRSPGSSAVRRAQAELAKARKVIEAQGNVSALLGELLEPSAATENTER